MRWWPFGRRRDEGRQDGGRHAFGAAVTSLPTGPLRLGEPEPVPETVLPWETGALDDSAVWSDGSQVSDASSDCSDASSGADSDPGPFSLGALLGQPDIPSDELSSADVSSSPFDLDLDLPQAASPALTVVPGAAWTGPDLGRPLEVASLPATWAVSEEPMGPPAEYELGEDVAVSLRLEPLEETLTVSFDELGEDLPVLSGDGPTEHLAPAPVPLLGLDPAHPLPGPVLDGPALDGPALDVPVVHAPVVRAPLVQVSAVHVPVVRVHVPVDVPVVHVLDVPLGREPVAVAADPVPVPVPVMAEPVPDAAAQAATPDTPPVPAAPVRRRAASSAVFVPTPPAPRPVDPLPWLATVVPEPAPLLPTVQEEAAGDLHFPVVVAPPFVPAGPPPSLLTGLLPEPRGDQHDQSGARVQLGFRDGSHLVLPPGSEPSRALQELARILLARQ